MITKQDLENFEGDKRSRAYKELKEAYNSQEITYQEGDGLGDKIEDVLEATGIAKVAKAILGDDCGCEERKRKFNEMRLYAPKQQRCFTEEEETEYQNFLLHRKTNKWTAEEVTLLFRLYADIFGKRYNIKRMCGSCMGTANTLKNITSDLDKAFESINN
jgi:hypothetical protein